MSPKMAAVSKWTVDCASLNTASAPTYAVVWRNHQNFTTETEACVTAWPLQNESSAVDRADLPQWCSDALQPWEQGERHWPAAGYCDWLVTIEVGWPWRALAYRFSTESAFQRESWNSSPIVSEFGIELKRSNADVIALPYLPLWPGMLMNATAFGLGWLVLSGLYRVACQRRVIAWRKEAARRRVCESCGYSLNGIDSVNSVCPECGWCCKQAE